MSKVDNPFVARVVMLSEAEISSKGWDGPEPVWTIIAVDVLDITVLKI